MNWADYIDGIAALFDQGGPTLVAILLASILLWTFIAERYWFHWRQLPGLRARLLSEWRDSAPTLGRPGIPRLQATVADLQAEARRNLQVLQALTGILPLLGLLGTVSGMIKVFDVITVFGTGNTRGMAAGISEALVTTMAGLFTALSGMYFVANLENRADELGREFEAELMEVR